MNCQKCNKPLKDGAKFCTSCGSKVEAATTNVCKSCGKELKVGAKFCTGCGNKVDQAATPIVETQTSTPTQTSTSADASKSVEMSIINHKLIWNIQPGEIARVISEEEFRNYNEVTGLIINEGTKALIRLNGEVVSEIKSGVYDFVDPRLLESELNKGGLLKAIKKGWNVIANLFKSSKPNSENTELAEAINKIQGGDIFSVVLVLDIPFKIIYGAEQNTPDDYANFIPMQVQARNLDIALGLSVQFRISDVREFTKHYMLSKNGISASMIVAETASLINAGVKSIFSEVDIENNVLPKDIVLRIEECIKSLSSDALCGLSLVRVIDVTIESEDLTRFRNISQELYLTERELEYLQRTNDFKNRLTDIENNQEIHEANSDLELHRRLQEINKDKILSDDELDKFYMVLSRERKIREAKNEDEIQAALQDIERTQLLRNEDLDVLRSEIESNKHKRGFAFNMMSLKDEITYQKTLKSAEYELQSDFVKAEIEQQRLKDNYNDEKYHKQLAREKSARQIALELQRQEAEQNLDLKEREAERQMNDFMRMAELKRNMQKDKHQMDMEQQQQHMNQEREMAQLDLEKSRVVREGAQNLSAEQLMALAANENLGGEAALEFARSFSAGKDKAEQKEDAEKLEKLNQARVDDMKDMMRMMMDNNLAMNNNIAHVKEESYRENKERLIVEQQRLDKTQDRALDYTTRNNIGPMQPQVQPQMQPQMQPQPQMTKSVEREVKTCRSCGYENESSTRFCEECGTEI